MAQTISKVGLEMSYILLGVILIIVLMQINNGTRHKNANQLISNGKKVPIVNKADIRVNMTSPPNSPHL